MPRFLNVLAFVNRWERPVVLRRLCLFLTGASGAACLLAAWLQAAFWLGTTLPISTGMAVSLVAGLSLGLSPWTLRLWRRFSGSLLFAIGHLALALQAACSLWLIAGLNRLLESGVIRPDAPVTNGAIGLLLTLPLVGIPAALIAGLSQGLLREKISFGAKSQSSSLPGTALPWGLGGSLAGIMSLALFAAYGGLTPVLLGFAGISSGLAIWSLWRWSQDSRKVETVTQDLELVTEHASKPAVALQLLAAILLGGMMAATERIIEQLSPVSVYSVVGEWSGLVCGCLFGVGPLLWSLRRGRTSGSVHRMWLLTAAVGAALIPASFPVLLHTALGINTAVPEVWLSLACRVGLAMLLLPLAAAWASIAISSLGTTEAPTRGGRGIILSVNWFSVALCGFGFVLSSACLLPQISPTLLLVGGAWGLCLIVVAEFALLQQWPATWPRRMASLATVGVLIAGSFLTANYDPARSAKVLFATNTFMAWRGGVSAELLPFLDQGRLESTRITERGVLTLWNYGGYQFHLRDNGIPRGIVSTDGQLFPQFAPEMMQAAVPLVLHEGPQRVLVLGSGSGLAVTTALLFPVQQVVGLEGERGQLKLLKENVFPACVPNPLEDDRLSLRVVEPALGVAAESHPYDVIISVADQGALLKGQVSLTREFYRRAAARLTPNGIFCQRFQFIDAGPEPIRQMARTMQSVFANVTALEVASGELLCLGTNDPRGLVRKGLLQRLQSEHSRHTFSQMGLDWSVMLNLPAFGQEELAAFASGKSIPVNGAAKGQFAFLMPREVLRWSNKMQEVQKATAQQVGRFADWLDEAEATSPELVRRLAEVTAQQDLLVKHSEQYWAYRASLRDQVQNHPRSLIQQVAATEEQKRLHPEDRRRIAYFNALSNAVESRSGADIQKLLSFQAPYDPLITFFVHQEAAELLAGSVTGNPVAEFRLRLHAIYFTSPQDRSMRNVLHALKLLREHPEIEANPTRRWDHFNSLLQMLQARWEARIGVPSTQSTQVILGEVNTSILEAEKTFDLLGPLAIEAGLPAESWPLRRRVLELRLIRPLNEYHDVVFNHQQQLLHKREAEAEAVEAVAPQLDPLVP